MKMTSEEIEEYRQFHLEEFGEELALKEAEIRAQKLINLMKHIFNA